MKGANVSLSDNELVLLDGRCAQEVQAKVDAAKDRMAARAALPDVPPHIASLVADVVTEARSTGVLIRYHERIRHCGYCGRSGGYVKFKSGPRRGSEDFTRPIHLNGVEFASRFFRVKHSVAVGACTECVEQAQPLIVEALRGVEAEVPDSLRAEGEPKWKRYSHRRCTKCGWAGHEGEMGKLRTLMGDGWYHGVCPSCGAQNLPLSRMVVDIADGFSVVVEEAAPA